MVIAARTFYRGNRNAEAAEALLQRYEDRWRQYDVEQALADAGWVDPSASSIATLRASIPAEGDIMEALQRCSTSTEPLWPRDAILALVGHVLSQFYPRLVWSSRSEGTAEGCSTARLLCILCDVLAKHAPCQAKHVGEHCVLFVVAMKFAHHHVGAHPSSVVFPQRQYNNASWHTILQQHEHMVTAAVGVTQQPQLRRLSIAMHAFVKARIDDLEQTDVGQLLIHGRSAKLPGLAVGVEVQQLWRSLSAVIHATREMHSGGVVVHNGASYWASSAKDPTAFLPEDQVEAINAQLSSIGRRSSPETVLG